ncbi:DUF4251 domain-containing protein [Winogradskyella algicola]|uniref:DUF4251 domain-containing protein n=1 Tax=Winogradskyella algicola TaxID=2575815 RepID=UPI0011084ED1|nr:DUF4251 domain-containing protein [Winogradskyella algicola]
MNKLIIFCLLATIAIPSISYSQSGLSKEEKVQAMYDLNKKIIESQNFSFIATWVFSDDKRGQVSESANTITINNSNVYGSLATLKADKSPTMLKGAMQNYSVNYEDSAHEITISFNIGAYNATLTVKSNSNAFLILNSENKETLTYKGFVK